METMHIDDLREIAVRAKHEASEAIDEIINAIDTKILVGNIHIPAEKKPRKKRTRKVKVEDFPPPRLNPLNPVDGDHPFYDKPKRGRKKKEMIDMGNQDTGL